MLSFTDPVIVLSMFMLSFIVPTIVLSMFMLSFTDPAIVLSMFMLSFFFVIVCGLLSGNESVIVGINPIQTKQVTFLILEKSKTFIISGLGMY
jgi:hypothetical protein